MPDGFSLNIDPKFMQDLEKAEKKIQDIATASEKTRDIVIDSFTKMRTQGLDPFVQAAKTFQQEMRGMRVVNLGLGVVTREASAATDKINSLVEALNKLLVANGKVNASNSKDSNVSKVNQLYKERLQIEERLHKMMLKGAQGKTVSPYESQNISRLAQRAQVIEQEIKQLQNSSKVSSQVILAIMKNEEQYTQAVQRFANERQAARNVEAEQQRKEAEAERIRQAQLAKQRAEMYKKQNYAQNTTSQGALKFSDTAQTYNREKQAIEYLTIARNNLSKSDKDYANTLELLNKAIRKHEENLKNATRTQEELTAAQNKRNKTSRSSSNQADKQYAQNIRDYNNAMKASEATINQRTNKLARLRQVEAQMAQDEAKYATQLAKVRGEIERLSTANEKAANSANNLKNNQRKLLDTSGQLQRQLALLFSVSAIEGYMNKLVSVRKEFELQQKSLQVLLQNKDEANKLWNQTLELAVKSPFRVKELVTYTRQLAAYRIETSKLHDTTRRLADVSAGLGVDMQRLILAFGQVRAANYLRGTELRQFTEAGIPMLDELAKHFTELEGKAISAGDVFEMISKRMVAFEDVEAVFKKMTSEGGAFFQMQEEQSKTLAGMISNLHDSVDLMLNDIGQQYDGMMKGSINFARVFVDNWKLIGGSIQGVIAALAGYKLYQLAVSTEQLTMLKLMKLGWSNLTTTMKGASATMKSVLTFNAPLLAVTLLIKGLWELNSAMNEHKEKIEEISNEYDKLRERAGKIQLKFDIASNEGNIKEQRSKLNELVNLANNEYHMSIKVDVEKLDTNELQAKFNEIAENMFQTNIFSEHFAKQMQKSTEWVVEDDIFEDLNQLETKTNNLFNELALNREKIVIRLKNAQDKLTESQKKALEILSKPKAAEQSDEDYFKQLQDGYKALMSKYEQYAKVASSSTVGNVRTKNIQLLTTEQKVLKGLGLDATKYLKFYGEWNAALKEAENEFNAFAATINLDKNIPQEQKEIRLKAAIDKMAAQQDWDDFVKNYIYKWTNKKFEVNIVPTVPGKEELKAWQKTYNQKFGDLEATLNIDESYAGFKKITNAAMTQNEVIERLNSNYEETEKLIKRIEKAGGDSATKKGGAYEGLDLEKIKKELKQIDEQRKWLGNDGKDKGKGKGKDWMSEVVKGVKEAHQEYVKLNKTLDSTEAKQMALNKYEGVFAEAAKNAGLQGISLGDLTFETEQGTIDALNALKEKLPEGAKQARLQIEKAISEIHGEIRIKTKMEQDKNLMDEIEKMFGQYEISLELQKLNVPSDLAKSLFSVDTTSLKDIRNKIQSEINAIGTTETEDKGQQDRLKQLNELLKKVDDMEEKARMERLKKYVGYLKKAQSERVKIKLEEMRQIAEIDAMTELSDPQKSVIKQQVQLETQKKLDKQTWEDFKDSDMYVRLFEDLESASTKSIDVILQQLQQLKNGLKELDPTEVKEINRKIEELQSIKIDRNPFKGLADDVKNYIQYAKKADELQDKYQESVGKENYLKNTIDDYTILETKQSKELATVKQIHGEASKEYIVAESKLKLTQKILEQKAKELLLQKKISQEVYDEIVAGEKTKKSAKDRIQEVGAYISEAANALPGVASDMENVFGAMDAKTKDTIDSIATIGAGVGSAIQGFTSGNYIQAIAGIAQAIGGIFAIGDKKKERQIQREIKFVEELERAYQKLEKQIDRAYEVNTLKSSYDAAQKNIDAQIESYNKMIAAEDDKKKTDKDRIKEWELAIEDLKEKQREMLESQVEELGGSYDFSSITEEFVNSWLDAFKETGNGLSGLEDNFEDFWRNIAIKQAVMGGASKIMQPLLDAVNKSLEDDFKLDDKEMANIDKLSSKAKEDMNLFLQQWYDRWGSFINEGRDSELSGLQRGIQGVTEETAQIIEAYLNSVRFYVADSNSKLTMIANQIIGGDETANPMLSELKTQTEMIRAIRDMFSSVIRNGHPTFGGAFIKVAL